MGGLWARALLGSEWRVSGGRLGAGLVMSSGPVFVGFGNRLDEGVIKTCVFD